MQSSRTSDHVRVRRALTDPWGLGLAAAAGVSVWLLGWGPAVAAGVGVATLCVRIAAEYLVPRPAALELEDSRAAQEERVRSSLAAVQSTARGRLPVAAADRVSAIVRIILDLLDRGTSHQAQSTQLIVLLSTATDYLPGALDAYLRLPAGYATSRRLDGDRTALEVLLEQLELLEAEMLEIADAFSRNDIDRLLAHGRFLADRFGHSELALQETHA